MTKTSWERTGVTPDVEVSSQNALDVAYREALEGLMEKATDDRLREAYGRLLARTLAARPAVYLVWIVLSLCTVPMFVFSPSELAPMEDQSVLFGIINTAANATTDQNAVYGAAAEKVMLEVPESALTFQLLFPPSIGATIGADWFSGMVVKPWDARERTIFQILPGVPESITAGTCLCRG